ncbi:MAG TPA: hypothetical protein PKV16_01095 [Caldisericia bacterium]|nr:hypothetical protein [Caldisericia bacterium]HPF48992.1 hypothetical protein [Caldisericia bacterium]HPI83144.1 hypothetical protein [Caldisericia bacterium]HPQ92371.1 hypothetical protein [Caldisericia bacterium]HRV74531.1 hypothetical protein [Caldisericia bacterium]
MRNSFFKFFVLSSVLVFLLVFLSLTPKTIANHSFTEIDSHSSAKSQIIKRANRLSSFTVKFKINLDILPNDWIRIWFPIKEASYDEKDYCKSTTKYSKLEDDPRHLIENVELYWTSREEVGQVGRLYEVADHINCVTTFINPTGCPELDESCRIKRVTEDGTRLRLLGTVFPALPNSSEKRKEMLAQMTHSVSIGYCPNTESVKYINLTQTKDTSMIELLSHMYVETGLFENDIVDINFPASFGIIPPTSPGRYRLKVATRAEPTPVETENFQLQCSIVSKPEISITKKTGAKSGIFRVKFHVGEGGALDKKLSTITVSFPKCLAIGKVIKDDISINNTTLIRDPYCSKQDNSLVVQTPINIENNGEITMNIDLDIFQQDCSDGLDIGVSTSSEPEIVWSDTMMIDQMK